MKYTRDTITPDVLSLIADNAPRHPELADGKIIEWQHGYRFIHRNKKGKAVGLLCVLPQELTGPENDTGWLTTLILDMSLPREERRKVFRMFYERAVATGLTISAVGVVEAIIRTYKRLGMPVRYDWLNMYCRILRPIKFLRGQGKTPLLAPVIIAGNAVFRPESGVPKPTKQIQKIVKFEPEWDATWRLILTAQHLASGVRTAEYLNYKLSQPNRDYQCLGWFNGKGPGAYIIYRLAKHNVDDLWVMKICDLVGEEDAKSALLNHAIAHATNNTDVYGVVALGASYDKAFYRKNGMWVSRKYIIATPPRRKLNVTFFDSDLDNLW